MRLSKRNRIILLLKTRQDALEETGELGGGALGSRSPRHGPLYWEGSYRALETCLDYLQEHQPRIRWHLTNYYAPPKDIARHYDASLGKWKPGLKPRRGYAELGVTWLEQKLSTVYVPQAVSENAGYLASEAKAYTRPRQLDRAA